MPTQPNGEKHYLTLEAKNENFTSITNARCWGALFGPCARLRIDMTISILLWRWDNMGKLWRLENTILYCNNFNLFVYNGKIKFYIWLKHSIILMPLFIILAMLPKWMVCFPISAFLKIKNVYEVVVHIHN